MYIRRFASGLIIGATVAYLRPSAHLEGHSPLSKRDMIPSKIGSLAGIEGNTVLTERELQMVDELSARLGTEPMATDRGELRRYLMARNWSVQNAFNAISKYIAWRDTFHPDDIQQDDCLPQFLQSKAYWTGLDKLGHPTLVFKMRRHVKGDTPGDIRFTTYMLTQAVRSMRPPVERYVLILDHRNSNTDLGYWKEVARVMEHAFPERLVGVYVLHANWVFHWLFAVVRLVIPVRTAQKVHLFSNNYKRELLELYDADQLEEEYGGSCKESYQYSPMYRNVWLNPPPWVADGPR